MEYAGLNQVQIEATFTEKGMIKAKYTLLRNLMMEITELYQMPDWKDALKEYITNSK